MYAVSACLAGIHCKYSGETNYNEKIENLVKAKKAILICPEQLGGLKTPRPAAEIIGGTGSDVLAKKAKVIDKEGNDVSEQFIKGAKEALEILKLYDIKEAILKANSPSCGCGTIYDGKFEGVKIKGDGVTSALFKENGIKIYNEDDFEVLGLDK